ncbi:hypothetical protein BVC80_715g34 [Macleaya cordata]|uniref:Uncharacterized protein n=1 Tax=Macleaya cordata TaxID=56857 RepID=A0A200PM98_MACCD|nr:hypothetical protein BVC80_715g34 [Macleaya cordata]
MISISNSKNHYHWSGNVASTFSQGKYTSTTQGPIRELPKIQDNYVNQRG